jgi:hypothetical protein
MMYRVFKRTWYRENPSWPTGLEPCAGKRRYFRGKKFDTEAEARAFCMAWNDENPRGRLSLRAEFEEV